MGYRTRNVTLQRLGSCSNDLEVDRSQTDLPNAEADVLQHSTNSIDADMTRLMAAADSDLASDAVTLPHSDEIDPPDPDSDNSAISDVYGLF